MSRHSPYRIGSLAAGSLAADPPNAASAYTECRNYTCTTSNAPDLGVVIARKEPTGTERGTVVLLSGQGGDGFYSQGSGACETWIDTLKVEGWRIFQVKWGTGGWNQGTANGKQGAAMLAGRAATAVKWIYDNHVAGAVHNFWLVGNSGGSDQAAYCMTHYGLDIYVDGVVMGGGPPRAGMLAGCRSDAGLSYDSPSRIEVDDSYDYDPVVQGHCELANMASASAWDYDDLQHGHLAWNAKSFYLFGSADSTVAPAHGILLADRQPSSVRAWPSLTPHDVQSDPNGRFAIANCINDRPVIRQSPGLTTATATSITGTFAKAVKAGSFLWAAHRATTVAANINTPSGWTLGPQVAFGAAATMQLFYKVADGTETNIVVTSTLSTTHSIVPYEVAEQGVTNWALDQVDTNAAATGTSVVCGPVPTTTAAKEMVIAVAGWSTGTPGTINNDWTNSFVQQDSNVTGRMAVAVKSLDATGTPSTTVTHTTSANGASLMATVKTA